MGSHHFPSGCARRIEEISREAEVRSTRSHRPHPPREHQVHLATTGWLQRLFRGCSFGRGCTAISSSAFSSSRSNQCLELYRSRECCPVGRIAETGAMLRPEDWDSSSASDPCLVLRDCQVAHDSNAPENQENDNYKVSDVLVERLGEFSWHWFGRLRSLEDPTLSNSEHLQSSAF